MKKLFLGIVVFCFFSLGHFVFSQTKIVLKDKTELKNVKVWNIYSNKIEYESNESLHDLLLEKIARIETDTAVLSFNESGELFTRPYDWIIKSSGDTIQCIISQLGGNYIYYYQKGKDNRSYVPVASVKDYKVQEPKLAQKLEQGSAVYSGQISDTLKSDSLQKEQPAVEQPSNQFPDTSNQKPAASNQPYKPEEKKIDSLFSNSKEEKNIPVIIQTDICYDSYMQGVRDANKRSEAGWAWATIGANSGGFFTCGAPTSIFSLIAINTYSRPAHIPPDVDEKCYKLGYQNQRQKNRVNKVAVGGLVSSAIILTIFYMWAVSGGI